MDTCTFEIKRQAAAHRRRATVLLTALATLGAGEWWVRRNDRQLAEFEVNPHKIKLAGVSEALRREPIVLMGSSRAKYALDPRVFEEALGAPAYNLGIPGTKVTEWRELAEAAFAEKQPRLVVLGVNASELRGDYAPTIAAEQFFDLSDFCGYLLDDGWSTDVAAAWISRAASGVSAFYARRYELKLSLQRELAALLPKHAQLAEEVRQQAIRPPRPDGFEHPWLTARHRRTLAETLAQSGERAWEASVPEYDPQATGFEHFGDLLLWFQRRGIPLLVAYVPNSPRTERRWERIEPEMIERIADLCSAHGVPFVGAGPAELPRSNADFIEELHVTLPMAARLSRRVAAAIVKFGLAGVPAFRMASSGADEGSP